MNSLLSNLGLPGLVTALVNLGVNLTGKQYEYLKWRTSDEGKKAFKQKDTNRFYEALEKGDTKVMDVEIKERQKEIDGLLNELGPLCILISCLLFSGCIRATIPLEVPVAHPGSLLANEKSYVVNNMKVKTPDGDKETLKGSWHVVSAEFIKVHRTNQDNLLAALNMVKKQRRNAQIMTVFAAITLIVGFILGFRTKKDKV